MPPPSTRDRLIIRTGTHLVQTHQKFGYGSKRMTSNSDGFDLQPSAIDAEVRPTAAGWTSNMPLTSKLARFNLEPCAIAVQTGPLNMSASNPDCFDIQPGAIAVESGSKAVGWRTNRARLEGEFRREGTASVGVASLLV
jgi:hypothetical protein